MLGSEILSGRTSTFSEFRKCENVHGQRPRRKRLGRCNLGGFLARRSTIQNISYMIINRSMKLAIREYLTPQGNNPFREWLKALDMGVQARIQARVLRFESGNLGDHKNVGGGIWEARLDFGPGYRLYFGKDGAAVILLLAGGDKASQSKDIAAAKHYWKDFREAKYGKAQ